MTNITQKIWELISNDITLQKNLARKLVNVRALAKYLIKQYNLKASLDSVITAIRRYESEEKFEESSNTIEEALKGSNVSTRSKIACLTLRENSSNAKYIHALLEDKQLGKDGSIRISKGSEYLKIVINEDDLEKVKEKLSETVIIEVIPNLAEIVVFLNKKGMMTPGICARIMNEISCQGVNILEIITALPEVLVYVNKADLVKSHDALFKLCCK